MQSGTVRETQAHATHALEEALGVVIRLRLAVLITYGRRSPSILGNYRSRSQRPRKLWAIRNSATMLGSASTQTNLGTLYYKLGQWPIADPTTSGNFRYNKKFGDHYTLGLRSEYSDCCTASGRLDEALQML